MIVQLLFMSLLVLPVIWAVINAYQIKGLPAANRMPLVKTLLNSAVLYALAFNLVFFIQELFLTLGKKALGLKAFLYHNNHTWEGSHPKERLMQGLGALAIMVFGLMMLLVYKRLNRASATWRLLLLWLAFQGLMQSIPQITIAYFAPSTDVGQALVDYLQLSDGLRAGLGVLATLSIPPIAFWFSRELLRFAPLEMESKEVKNRLRYLRFIAAGAAVIGCVLIIPFRIMPWGQVVAPILVSAFTIPWVWVSSSKIKPKNPISNELNQTFKPWPLIALGLLLLLFQGVLASGVVL